MEVPLFLSHRSLRKETNPWRAKAPWALDSGGFTELNMFGRWTISEEEYIDAVLFYEERIGYLQWCAPQDWMCEPHILAKTGRGIEEHLRATVASYVRLRSALSSVIPILQGWTLDDYDHCRVLYEEAGVDLSQVPLVGLGSVCRRQGTAEIYNIVKAHSDLALHGFGVKTDGLAAYGDMLRSADSMAWSHGARLLQYRLPGHAHLSCSNCLEYALQWREKVLHGFC